MRRFCFFSYAHKPGMSRALNRWLSEQAARLPEAIALGTLHPDDPDLDDIAREATGDLGLRGFKFHSRCSASTSTTSGCSGCTSGRRRRATCSCSTWAPCRIAIPSRGRAVRAADGALPRLRVCVAHMGAFESAEFLALLPAYPHLYVDTTMAMTSCATPYTGADPGAVPMRTSSGTRTGCSSARTSR